MVTINGLIWSLTVMESSFVFSVRPGESNEERWFFTPVAVMLIADADINPIRVKPMSLWFIARKLKRFTQYQLKMPETEVVHFDYKHRKTDSFKMSDGQKILSFEERIE